MITEEQRQRRRGYLGSSDSAAVAGLSDWKSRGDVYIEKTCDMLPTQDTLAIFLGNYLEPVLIQWAESELGFEAESDVMQVHEDNLLCANFDALNKDRRCAIEAKTRGIIWPGGVSDEWGDDGTDEVAADVYCQCQHQMYVGGLDVVYVPCIIGGKGRRMYEVKRAARYFMDSMVGFDNAFWENHVKAKRPPVDGPRIETVNRIKRQSESPRAVPQDVFDAYLSTRLARLEAEKASKTAEALLKSRIGDGDAAQAPNGLEITMTEVHKKAYSVAATSYWRLNPPE